MGQFTRTTVIDASPGADTTKAAVIDVDTDLTGIVAAYNAHDTATTNVHGFTGVKTGSGAMVGAISPALVTPALGTPSAIVLTNASGTVTNLTLVTPTLGTPASGVLTNCTGLPLAGLAANPIASSISDGDTTHAPDGNSVFDALALKQAKSGDGLAITAGKTITCTQDATLDEAVAMSSKATKLVDTWIPVLTFDGASTEITYITQLGKYTRIANVVFYQIALSISSKGSATGAAAISLPSTPAANPLAQGILSEFYGLTIAEYPFTQADEGVLQLYRAGGSGTGNVPLTNVQFAAGTVVLRATGFYME